MPISIKVFALVYFYQSLDGLFGPAVLPLLTPIKEDSGFSWEMLHIYYSTNKHQFGSVFQYTKLLLKCNTHNNVIIDTYVSVSESGEDGG
jgi:hypothetical protein